MKNLFKLIVFFVGTSVVLATNHYGKYTKQKSLQKTVLVNSDATLSVKNKYGNLLITTWDEDKIGIEVTITVSADSEKWVEEKLNSITVDFNGSKSLYSAETQIDSNESYGRNSSMEINYTIKIPKKGNVKLDNKYGDIIMHDLNGSSDIICKYGKISLGNLKSNSNIIKIDYCPKSTIASIKNASIEAKYSGISIDSFEMLALTSSYTDITIKNGTNLNYKSNYGKIAIEKVTNLVGNGNYLTINIDEIEKNLTLSTNYSNLTLGTIAEKANDISIDAGYTNIKINHSANYSFDFDISTRYGNFKTNSELSYSTKVEKNTSKSYTGFYNKSGINQLRLSSNYGNITLNSH